MRDCCTPRGRRWGHHRRPTTLSVSPPASLSGGTRTCQDTSGGRWCTDAVTIVCHRDVEEVMQVAKIRQGQLRVEARGDDVLLEY